MAYRSLHLGKLLLGSMLLCGGSVLAQSLVTPGALTEATALYRYLHSIRSKGVLTGCHNYGEAEPNRWPQYIKDKTGEYPAVKGFDVSFHNGDDAVFGRVANASVAWWRAGGVVTMTWHWAEYGGQEYYQGNNVSAALKAGTPENTAFNKDLDRVAERVLKPLQTQKVPVLWRPFHELNGGWFWWGGKGETTKALWVYMFKRYTGMHGLRNLIWVWSPNFSPTPSLTVFPGHQYVDVLGTDYYAQEGLKPWSDANQYNALVGLANGKPLCVGECARTPDVARTVKETPNVAWFLIWGNRAGNTEINPLTWLRTQFTSTYALNRGDIRYGMVATERLQPARPLAVNEWLLGITLSGVQRHSTAKSVTPGDRLRQTGGPASAILFWSPVSTR